MLEEPVAHETMLVIKRLLPRLSFTPLLRESISMLKMQKGRPRTSMQISSLNTHVIGHGILAATYLAEYRDSLK